MGSPAPAAARRVHGLLYNRYPYLGTIEEVICMDLQYLLLLQHLREDILGRVQ